MSISPPSFENVVRTIPLRCGTLSLQVDRASMPLGELCTFGSRRSLKRGFQIISKVLGKNVPVRPSQMERIHNMLASQICNVEGPILLVALAETAIGLGQGVFESLLRLTGRDDVLFLHSTRYRLSQPLAATFQESHSHATEHFLYFPLGTRAANRLKNARTLVLVDDEITTGRTLTSLAYALAQRTPRLSSVHFLSITDWLDPSRRRQIVDIFGRNVALESVLRGQLHFTPDLTFDPGPIPNVVGAGEVKDSHLKANHGRLGTCRPLVLNLGRLQQDAGVRSGERILILGTGEFVHAPYLLSRHLEELGWDVSFQSTTRSPILVGEGIDGIHEFVDNYHDEIPNYVYNVATRLYDRIIIGYETRRLPPSHRLAEMLGAHPVFFDA